MVQLVQHAVHNQNIAGARSKRSNVYEIVDYYHYYHYHYNHHYRSSSDYYHHSSSDYYHHYGHWWVDRQELVFVVCRTRLFLDLTAHSLFGVFRSANVHSDRDTVQWIEL